MRLIVGLGNPGRIYKYSRHNIGALLIEGLTKRWGIKIKRNITIKFCLGQSKVEDKEVMLARSFSWMNLSGYTLNLLLKKYGLNPEDMLVVFDDLDLELGKIRIKPRGSSGGHRGAESIVKALGSSNFPRLRIGIGRPKFTKTLSEFKQKKVVADYVLSNWTRREKEQLSRYLERAADCCEAWVIWGINKAMNKFN